MQKILFCAFWVILFRPANLNFSFDKQSQKIWFWSRGSPVGSLQKRIQVHSWSHMDKQLSTAGLLIEYIAMKNNIFHVQLVFLNCMKEPTEQTHPGWKRFSSPNLPVQDFLYHLVTAIL